jgi:hypothetical protein
MTDQDAQQLELDRREANLRALRAHDTRRQINLQVAEVKGRLIVAMSSAPQVRLEARDQFARPERLREVVVGTGLQRADLLLLVTDRGDSDQGIALQSRNRRHTPTPSPSGSSSSTSAASGMRSAARSSASLPVVVAST